MSDYDCINNGFEAKEPFDKLHLMHNDCPCFASGSPEQFEQLCHNFIEISLDRIEKLKNQNTIAPAIMIKNFFRIISSIDITIKQMNF